MIEEIIENKKKAFHLNKNGTKTPCIIFITKKDYYWYTENLGFGWDMKEKFEIIE